MTTWLFTICARNPMSPHVLLLVCKSIMSAKVNPTSDEGNSQGLSSETAPKTPKSASAEGRSADDATKPNTAVEATAPVDRRKVTFIMNPGGSAEKKYYVSILRLFVPVDLALLACLTVGSIDETTHPSTTLSCFPNASCSSHHFFLVC